VTEIWRPVPGREGYEVSSFGRVRSLDRAITHSDGRSTLRKGRLLKQRTVGKGYQRVQLRPGNEAWRVHRMVLLAFLGEPPEGYGLACHLDGNPSNNLLENLYWGSASDNMQDRIRHGTNPNAAKTRCTWGHAYTEENTYLTPVAEGATPRRSCQTCRNNRNTLRRTPAACWLFSDVT
jgi:hypothetical protein